MPASAISEQILCASLMRPETGGKGEYVCECVRAFGGGLSVGILCFGADKRPYLFRQHLGKSFESLGSEQSCAFWDGNKAASCFFFREARLVV